jgi:hypothetical protein
VVTVKFINNNKFVRKSEKEREREENNKTEGNILLFYSSRAAGQETEIVFLSLRLRRCAAVIAASATITITNLSS